MVSAVCNVLECRDSSGSGHYFCSFLYGNRKANCNHRIALTDHIFVHMQHRWFFFCFVHSFAVWLFASRRYIEINGKIFLFSNHRHAVAMRLLVPFHFQCRSRANRSLEDVMINIRTFGEQHTEKNGHTTTTTIAYTRNRKK